MAKEIKTVKIKKVVKKKVAAKTVKKAKENSNDFAVIETGGKQYLVRSGDRLKVEKLKKPEKGTDVVFEKVLLSVKNDDVKIGNPYIKSAEVKAVWSGEKKGKKITMAKYKSKTRRLRKKGHTQTYTEVVIGDF